MILGSIVIGLILGLLGFVGWWYYKDWKDKKYVKENKEEIDEKIKIQRNKLREVKKKRENDWKRISDRTKQEHRSGATASGRKPKTKNKKSSENPRGVSVSNNNNTLRP